MKTKKEIINELENLKKYTGEAVESFTSVLLKTRAESFHIKFLIDKIIKTHPEIISIEDYDEAEEESLKLLEIWKNGIEYLKRETH